MQNVIEHVVITRMPEIIQVAMKQDAALKAPNQTRELEMGESSTQKPHTPEEQRGRSQELPLPTLNTGAAASEDHSDNGNSDTTATKLYSKQEDYLREVLDKAEEKRRKERAEKKAGKL